MRVGAQELEDEVLGMSSGAGGVASEGEYHDSVG